MDLGVLTLKPGALDPSFYPDAQSNIPRLLPSHSAIIEWRALTVVELYVPIVVMSMMLTHAQ